jgi:hypothetical protein
MEQKFALWDKTRQHREQKVCRQNKSQLAKRRVIQVRYIHINEE